MFTHSAHFVYEQHMARFDLVDKSGVAISAVDASRDKLLQSLWHNQKKTMDKYYFGNGVEFSYGKNRSSDTPNFSRYFFRWYARRAQSEGRDVAGFHAL